MSYDRWKTAEPDPNDDGERHPPPGPEEAWEYWYERAQKAEAEVARLRGLLVDVQLGTLTMDKRA